MSDQRLDELSDDALLAHLKDPATARETRAGAHQILVDRYWPRVYQLALPSLRDSHAAEDLAQELACEIPRLAQSYDPGKAPGGFWPYFRAVVCNRIRDRMRSRQLRTSADLHLLEENLKGPEGPAADVTGRDDADDLLKYNWPDQKDCMFRMYVEGLSAEEIAASLRMTPREVYVHVDNGKKRLGDVLLDRVLNLRNPLPEHLRLTVLRAARSRAVPRRPRTAPPLAARGPAVRRQWLEPVPDGILLDRLRGCLDWEQEPAGRWQGLLRFWSRGGHHPEGNDETLLRPFDRAQIILQWTASGPEQSGRVETVLKRDAAGDLVSRWFYLAIDPDGLTGVKMMVQGWLE
jgi:RNA polymerase sigma factor (sigma-70 family)